jgi:hypothetical protein
MGIADCGLKRKIVLLFIHHSAIRNPHLLFLIAPNFLRPSQNLLRHA